MKSIFLLVLLALGFNADAQTLKELLYSGKLKKDSSAVIRKTDDLSTKIDTTQKKAVAQENKPVQEVKKETPVSETKENAVLKTETNTTGEVVEETNAEKTETPVPSAAPVKSNTKIWKVVTDALVVSLKEEELKNKKIKKGTYFFIIEYELGTEGQVSILNVTSSPENNLLQAQVKSKLEANPPTLTPALDSAGNPRKVKRKQSFSVEKD